MKTPIKATMMAVAMAATMGGVAPDANAQSACAACSPWVISPDGNAAANSVTVIDGVAQFLSGNPDTTQAQGIFGAGFTWTGTNFSMEFDADLWTWDSYVAPVNPLSDGTGYYDAFVVTVSTAGYYWNLPHTDPITADASTFVWGGQSWSDGIEESYITAPGTTDMISMSGSGTFYVSLVLDTQTLPNSDIIHPSWGSFHVAVIPEPETYAMLLAGLGLMGFVARRRQRSLAAA